MAERSGLQNGRVNAGFPLLWGERRAEHCADGKGGFQGRPLSWCRKISSVSRVATCRVSGTFVAFALRAAPLAGTGGTCFSFCSLRVFASGFAFPAGRPLADASSSGHLFGLRAPLVLAVFVVGAADASLGRRGLRFRRDLRGRAFVRRGRTWFCGGSCRAAAVRRTPVCIPC